MDFFKRFKQSKTEVIPNNEMLKENVLTVHEGIDSVLLCQAAENVLLYNCITKDDEPISGRIMFVNDNFIVKASGKLIGLCINDVQDESGKIIFKRGSWYAPIGQGRQQILNAFGIPLNEPLGGYALKTKSPYLNLDKVEWIYLRDQNTDYDLVDEVKGKIENYKDVVLNWKKLPTNAYAHYEPTKGLSPSKP